MLDDDTDAPFTPEAYPELGPEICEVLNTPLEQCDPAITLLLFAALAEHLANILPPELGLTSPDAVFGEIRDRFGGLLGNTTLDDALALALDEALEPPTPAVAPAPAAVAGPPAEAHATPLPQGSPTSSGSATTTDASLPTETTLDSSILRQPLPNAEHPGPGAATAAVAGQCRRGEFATAPPSVSPLPALREGAGAGRLARGAATVRGRRSLGRDSRPRLRRCGMLAIGHGHVPQVLPPRRLCYAACAGPP